jgi:hypothetical protein
MDDFVPCRFCKEFFAQFRCNAPDECDCPKCQGYCECEHSLNEVARLDRLGEPSKATAELDSRPDSFSGLTETRAWATPLLNSRDVRDEAPREQSI